MQCVKLILFKEIQIILHFHKALTTNTNGIGIFTKVKHVQSALITNTGEIGTFTKD